MVVIDGVDHALAFGIRGDNSGPPSTEEVIKDFAKLKELYPGATVSWLHCTILVTMEMSTKLLEKCGSSLITNCFGDRGGHRPSGIAIRHPSMCRLPDL